MKKLLLSLILLLLLLPSISCGTQGNNEADEIIVGMELAFPPFETTDAKGNPAGISVDLAYDLGEALGRPVKIENIAFSGLIPALQTNKIDLILSSMTVTEERLESIDFSIPYANAWLALLININSPVETVSDLNAEGRSVAVKRGTVGHIYAQEHLPQAEIMVFDKESACALEVAQGKVDAFIYDTMSIHKLWRQYEGSTKANLEPFEEIIQDWAIGIKKGNDELKEEINNFLRQYKEEGKFDLLAEKYLADVKEDFDTLGIRFFF